MPIEGTLEDPNEGYGPNDMEVPKIFKKGNSIMRICLSKSNTPKTYIYEHMY